MCGIAGYLGSFDPALLVQMGKAQGHRGPDGSDVWSGERAGLSHVRLAIIDLSEAGRQPMRSADGRVVVTFNGEIYNYRDLRRRLEREGDVFRGDSDTEVLANLLARHGESCLPWLNGIFAFAAWFPSERRMLLARDAAGVKPLYWARTPAGLGFASELKALRCLPAVDLSPDPAAIASYLTLLYAPGEATPVKGVRKILPGTVVEWREGAAPVARPFGPASYAQEIQPFSEKQAIDGLRHYLDQAVRRQLVADVPLGGFLSGGLDSTAIAHYALRHVGSPADYPCFTLPPQAVADRSEGFVDDHPYARQVSDHFGLPLHVARMDAEATEQLDWMVWQLDEPTPDLAAFTAHAICRAAQERGVKVLLSGAGGDDIFTGYRRHLALRGERYWGWLPRPMRAGLRGFSARMGTGTAFGRRFSKAFRYADAEPAERLASYFLWIGEASLAPALSPGFREQLGAGRVTAPLVAALASLPPDTSRLNQMLHLDRRFFLADHNLNYTDKMAMACGVEVRVPFLDPDLVAFSERLADGLKQHGLEGKYVLRQAMRGVLPDSVLDRPKSGFGFPLRRLIQGPYGRRLEELARSGRLDATGIFDGRGALALLEADRRGQVDAAYPLLGVLCVESWLRQFTSQ
jgi:asparagine synthase (glutamine-hydrolysing)